MIRTREARPLRGNAPAMAPSRVSRWTSDHPRVVDTILIIAYVAVQIAAVMVVRPTYAAVVLIGVALSAMALTRRRQHPVAVLLLVVGLAGVISALLPALNYSSLAVAVALYTVSARLSLARAWGWYALAVVIIVVPGLVMQAVVREQASTAQALDLFGVLAIVLGAVTRTRRERREAWVELVDQRAENAAAAERARIAAEMHDVVSHSLSVMTALANGAAAGWEKHPARAREALRQLTEVGATAMGDMRRILDVLSIADAEPQHRSTEALPGLDQLVDTFRSAGLPVTLTRTDVALPPDSTTAMTIYRIVQESLTNVLRHATAPTLVDVKVERQAGHIMISTSDNGHPIARSGADGPGAGGSGADGHGLANVARRAAAFDGRMEAGPRPLGGWRICVWLATDARAIR